MLPVNNITPPEEKERKGQKGLLFLEIGLFEIGFVLVILSILFVILNYFNILHLDTVFPRLSFLPHQDTSLPKKSIAPNIRQNQQPVQNSEKVATNDAFFTQNNVDLKAEANHLLEKRITSLNNLLYLVENDHILAKEHPQERVQRIRSLQASISNISKIENSIHNTTDNNFLKSNINHILQLDIYSSYIPHVTTAVLLDDVDYLLRQQNQFASSMQKYLRTSPQLKDATLIKNYLDDLQKQLGLLSEKSTFYKTSILGYSPEDTRTTKNFLVLQQDIHSIQSILDQIKSDWDNIRALVNKKGPQ